MEFDLIVANLKNDYLQNKVQHTEFVDFMENVKDPYLVLICCILSLRTNDKITFGASQRMLELAKTPEEMLKVLYNQENLIELLKICKGTPLELQIFLASGLGLRISEILGLTWDNIDFNENTITINKITVRNEGTVILKSPKTESSERTISAPLEIMNMLKSHKKKQLEDKLRGLYTNKLNLLFLDKDEKPIAQDVLSKKFSRFLRDNNLDHIRFHDLRHSHVTLLIKSKVPIKVISERVGHSNINTTLNIYAHTLKEMDSEASVKISESLFRLG
jgi:integrase